MMRGDTKTMKAIAAHARADIDADTSMANGSLLLAMLEGDYGCLCGLTLPDRLSEQDVCGSTNALAN